MTFQIYVIKRVSDGRAVYVGQTVSPTRRWKQHVYSAKAGRKEVVSQALRKHGVQNFEFCSLGVTFETQGGADDAERHMVKALRTHVDSGGYNVAHGGQRFGRLGSKHTVETRAKMSAAQAGNTKALGLVRTAENCRKVSEALSGRPLSESHRAAIVASAATRELSKEVMARLGLPNDLRARAVVDSSGRRHASIQEAARTLNLSASKICAIINGRRRRTGGYGFTLVDAL